MDLGLVALLVDLRLVVLPVGSGVEGSTVGSGLEVLSTVLGLEVLSIDLGLEGVSTVLDLEVEFFFLTGVEITSSTTVVVFLIFAGILIGGLFVEYVYNEDHQTNSVDDVY